MSRIKHELKLVQPYFDAVWDGNKTFEVRVNDRGYKIGDTVLLKEYDPINEVYSDRSILVVITYILANFYAVQDGYIVFSFEVLQKYEDLEYDEIVTDADFTLKEIIKFFIANPEIESILVAYSLDAVVLYAITTVDDPLNLANRYNINYQDVLDPTLITIEVRSKLNPIILLGSVYSFDNYPLLYETIDEKLSKYITIERFDVVQKLTPISINLERTLLEIEAGNVKR